jgi:hypothetical protein
MCRAHRRRLGALALAIAWVASLSAIAPAASRAAELEAGFGRANLVTKVPGVTLGGYGGRGLIPSVGVHDATMVKVMVLKTPERSVALITADLIGIQRTMLEALGRRGFPDRVKLTADDILMSASHTHAGYGSLAQRTGAPLLDGLFFVTCGPFRKAFFREVVDKVHGAIIEAWDDLAPARIGVGSEEIPGLSRNRGRGGDVTDPELGVIKVTSPDGDVRGLVVNFTAHPTIIGADVLRLSAGYPGAVQRVLEERFPGATALFTNGAEGDQSVSAPPGEYGSVWDKVEATGRRIAEHVARIQEGIACQSGVRLALRQEDVRFPAPSDWRGRLKYLGGQPRSLFCQVAVGDTLLMGVPGEPCCRIGLDMKAAAKRKGFRHAFVIGLAQDHCGYFVHRHDYGPGFEESHDYEKQLNFYGPGIGELIVRIHMEQLGLEPPGTGRAGTGEQK